MPPCISQIDGGLVQVAIEVEDRAQRSAITSKGKCLMLFCCRIEHALPLGLNVDCMSFPHPPLLSWFSIMAIT